MRSSFILFVSLMLCSCTIKNSESKDHDEIYQKAKKIHDHVITLDTHDDIDVKNFTDSINYSQRLQTQVNIPKMQEGGLDVAWFVVYTAQDSLNENGYINAMDNAIAKFSAIHRLVNTYAPDKIGLALNSDDVRSIHATGKKIAMIGVENAYPMGTDLGNVKKFYDLGARYMSLAHNGHSQFADSNTGEKDSIWLHHGLSELGKQAIIAMNKYGIMIDLSHPSKEANIQAINLSKAPVIASHSAARALCDQSRNLDDEVLKMIQKNGGVVQVVALDSYLNKEKAKKRAVYENEVTKAIMDSLGYQWLEAVELAKLPVADQETYYETLMKTEPLRESKMKKMKGLPPAVNVSDLVDHIDYLVKLIGIEHVGISSDFDGGGGIEGWRDASETFNVTYELVKRGYTEEQIGMLWSGNLLRVLDEVQKVAKEIQNNH